MWYHTKQVTKRYKNKKLFYLYVICKEIRQYNRKFPNKSNSQMLTIELIKSYRSQQWGTAMKHRLKWSYQLKNKRDTLVWYGLIVFKLKYINIYIVVK